MRIIPAIDIINGKCVRLTREIFLLKNLQRKSFGSSKEFEANGINYLHLVDLDGVKSKQIVNHKILYEITSKTKLKVDFSGGLKAVEI